MNTRAWAGATIGYHAAVDLHGALAVLAALDLESERRVLEGDRADAEVIRRRFFPDEP